MELAKQKIRAALESALTPAVLWSGGKDSSLLLRLAHEVRPDITAIHLVTGIKTDVGLIMELGVTMLSWPAADTYLLSDGDRRVRVQEFDFDGARLPVITDLEEGEQCARLPQPSLPFIATGFDVLLWGARDCDTHFLKAVSSSFPPDGYVLGKARLYAPLRHMGNEQIPDDVYPHPADALGLCSNCFSGGDVWCPREQAMIAGTAVDWSIGLNAFRQREAING